MFFLLAWSLALHPTRWLVNRALMFVGQLSYSAYLVHFALLPWAQRLVAYVTQDYSLPAEMVYFMMFSTTLTSTLLVSLLTHYGIEQPGIALGRRLIARREARVQPQLGVSRNETRATTAGL